MSSLRTNILWALLGVLALKVSILVSAVLDWDRLNIAFILLSVLFELWLMFAFLRNFVRPLEALTHATREVHAGTSQSVAVPQSPGGGEVQELAQSINAMVINEREGRADDRQQLFRTQETTRAVLNALPHAVILTSPDGKAEIANSAAERFGVFAGMDVHAFALQWLPELVDRVRKTRSDASLDKLVQFFEHGRELFLLPQAHPVLNASGDLVGIAVVLLDVTEKRLVEEARSGLVSAMSHQIKTPMTSIQMSIHLLLEDTRNPLTPRQMELLQAACDDADRLYRLIEEWLAGARSQQ